MGDDAFSPLVSLLVQIVPLNAKVYEEMGHRYSPGPTFSAAMESKWELWLLAVTSRAVFYLIQ